MGQVERAETDLVEIAVVELAWEDFLPIGID